MGMYTSSWLSDTTLHWFTSQQVTKLLVFKGLRLWNTDLLWSSFKCQFSHYKLTHFGIDFASQGLFSLALKWVLVCGSLWFSDTILAVAYWVCHCSQRRRWPSTLACPITDRNDGSVALAFIAVDVSRGKAFDLRSKNTWYVFIIDDSLVLSQESDLREFIKWCCII